MLVQNDKTSFFRLNLGQQLSSFSASFLGKLLRDAVAIDMKTAVKETIARYYVFTTWKSLCSNQVFPQYSSLAKRPIPGAAKTETCLVWSGTNNRSKPCLLS